MNSKSTVTDVEFAAMHTVFSALEPLDDDARTRIVVYVVARLEIDGLWVQANNARTEKTQLPLDNAALQGEQSTAPKYGSLAELFSAARPNSTAEKALVAGYWLQVCQSAENFDGFSANKELRNLGEGLPNITNAIDSLKAQQPQLVLQLKKSGISQQARKTYKLTHAGIQAAEKMIRRQGSP